MRHAPALFVLRLLRIGLLFCAGSVTLFFTIEVWKNWLSGAEHQISLPDYLFLAVLLGIFVGAVSLLSAIAREIRRMTAPRGDHD